MAGKRVSGEGSYGKRKINGQMYFYYRGADRKFIYGKTLAEVKEKRAKQQANPQLVVSGKLTVGEYVRDWFYNKKFLEVGITLQSTTFDAYEDAIKTRFFEFKEYPLASRQIQALTADNIQTYLKKLAEKYRRGSIQKTWEVLRMCFADEDYVNYKLMPKINLAKIQIPTESNTAVKKRNTEFTSVEDMEKIYNEALRKNGRGGYVYGTAARMLVFIMYSGLRVSEACGLKWKNVDINNQMITIESTHNTVRSRNDDGLANGYMRVDKAPKNEASASSIPYRKRAGEMLEIIAAEHPDHTGEDYVFLTNAGKPYIKREIEHTLKRILNKTGLNPEYTVHSLRHGYGSILYQAGVDIKTISRLLRHKNITTTANIYVATTHDTLKNILKEVDNS